MWGIQAQKADSRWKDTDGTKTEKLQQEKKKLKKNFENSIVWQVGVCFGSWGVRVEWVVDPFLLDHKLTPNSDAFPNFK